jgi:hypothetical protein
VRRKQNRAGPAGSSTLAARDDVPSGGSDMQAPTRITPETTGDYLAVMSKAVFQTGVSWKVVEAKWPGFLEAFHGFDAERVAALTPADVDRLVEDARIIRNRKKIEATIDNATEMVALAREHGSFRAYLRSHGGFEETVRDLRKRFRFIGELGAFYFLYVVGEEVPSYEEWCASRGRTPMVHSRPGR